MGRPEKRFWGTLSKAVLALAALVGLYLTAMSVEAVWAFWVVLGLGFLYAFFAVLVPRAYTKSVEITNRVTGYSRILELKVALEGEKESLLHEISELRERENAAHQRGLDEGVRQAWGAVASRVVDVPVLRNAIKESEGLVLIANCEESAPQPGARYAVVMRISGAVKGVVEVRKEGHSSRSVHLVCIEASDPRFWLRLADKAELEDDLPRNIQLTPWELPARDGSGGFVEEEADG